MKIIFMGTPDFAIPSLTKLFESKHKVSAVVTVPDREQGRGQKVSFSPVKNFAIQHNLPVLQPEKLSEKDPAKRGEYEKFLIELASYKADIFVIVAFKILPKEIFTIPPKGSFNLHASLLPKYRGAAPIQWAIINGEKETGVTTFALEEKVDTGNIFLQEKVNIEENDDFGIVHDKLSLLGADVVYNTVELIESGNYKLKKQNNELASPAPKINKETALINWSNSAESIHNLVRGLSPFPSAYFYYNGVQIKVYKTEVVNLELAPGKIQHSKNELIIGCGNKALKILELQKEGKKRMSAENFLRGFNF